MKYLFDEKEHLHTLDGKPLTGTSSVMDVLFKPLSWYASGKAVETLGWLNPKLHSEEKRIESANKKLFEIKGLTTEEYLKLLDTAYRAHDEHKKSRAKVGKDLHSELETYVKNTMKMKFSKKPYDEKIKPFIEWSRANVKNFIASEANCYSEKLWVGGVTDCVAEMNDGTLAVIDFKSAKEAYDSHFLQTAGYALQIEENGMWDSKGIHNKKLDKKFQTLIVVPFGAEEIKPVVRQYQLVEESKRGFVLAVELYRILGLTKTK